MKIISPYKDYYDYLQGIWGQDDKRILERKTIYKHDPNPESFEFFRIWFCNWQIDILCDNGSYIVSANEKEKYKSPKQWYSRFVNPDYIDIDIKHTGKYAINILKNPLKHDKRTSKNKDCPIIIEINPHKKNSELIKWPLLKDIGFSRVFSAEEAFLEIEKFITPQDNFSDKRTDPEKILSNGFDMRTSFRNTK